LALLSSSDLFIGQPEIFVFVDVANLFTLAHTLFHLCVCRRPASDFTLLFLFFFLIAFTLGFTVISCIYEAAFNCPIWPTVFLLVAKCAYARVCVRAFVTQN